FRSGARRHRRGASRRCRLSHRRHEAPRRARYQRGEGVGARSARISMPTPTIYYVRHGLTDWNVQQRLQGRHDVPLNAEGRAQAARCGEILRDLLTCDGKTPAELGFVSSPLARARTTMEIVRATLDLEPADFPVDERLVEIAFGA